MQVSDIDVKPGDPVSWCVYNMRFHGVVKHVYTTDGAFFGIGDILVRTVDGHNAVVHCDKLTKES